jgi:hypothetical protein
MTTAVEWLQMVLIPIPYDEEDVEHNKRCWEQAKEREKHQIINAFHTNSQKWFCNEEAEQYYNETFKQQEQ